MTEEPDQSVLFAEAGSSWWPVLWGPAFAAVGAAVEALGGPAHTVTWVLVGLGLAGAAAVWVSARRRLLSVRLTPKTLTQGQETLAVDRIAKVLEEAPLGARVLGGAWTVPRRFGGVGLRLEDGTTVLAWARDGDGLRAALDRLISG